jgi:hypothetical protein
MIRQNWNKNKNKTLDFNSVELSVLDIFKLENIVLKKDLD